MTYWLLPLKFLIRAVTIPEDEKIWFHRRATTTGEMVIGRKIIVWKNSPPHHLSVQHVSEYETEGNLSKHRYGYDEQIVSQPMTEYRIQKNGLVVFQTDKYAFSISAPFGETQGDTVEDREYYHSGKEDKSWSDQDQITCHLLLFESHGYSR